MGVTRTNLEFEDRFTRIPNDWLRDQRISRRARGLLSEIMSHRVGWHVTIRSLAGSGKEGRDAIQTALAELLEHGYIKRSQPRKGGKFEEVEYELTDPPTVSGFSGRGDKNADQTASGFTVSGSTVSGESATKKNISKEDHLEEEHGPAKRGSRIPDDFAVDDVMRQWAAKETPAVAVDRETENFKDWWAAKAGRDAVKVDWRRTWQTWMRRQQGFMEQRGWKPQASSSDAWMNRA